MLEQFKGKIVDYHAHLNDSAFDADRDEVVARAWTRGVEAIVDMAIDIPSAVKAIENAKKYKGLVFAAIGIDPEILIPGGGIFKSELLEIGDSEFSEWVEQQMQILRELFVQSTEYVVMIGETGMDRFHLQSKLDKGEISSDLMQLSLNRQKELFLAHIRLSKELNLPLSIHSRGIEGECVRIVKEQGGMGIFHCFTGELRVLEEIMNAGFGVGVSGIYTYKSGKELLENLKPFLNTNAEQIFCETDAPYLAPLAKRGARCEPGDVLEVVTLLRAQR